ncbi:MULTISPECIES: quinone-dependent dihydroorotate dehydrogenase [Salinivibrio]|uniref:Dihydroorotate dehydrogenase (quinone) n=1 Tax=Salinivibrio kushneri TaxID=1908198 RepID=A0AB36K5D8_9GAMM|nr:MULTISPECIES: quinone-dependent dihydroorotate dehydrogenase [Salinivibrio]ODP97102.1 dihydroorotate dehydrogenase (quinone) [Salinivibrio sp. BNH]OOE34129.1 dihydroorotate dehydrogenase (quinone) [Salinivibrio kushneri]OOE34232.1 dihydroorotate dehydrogenase (quinone) [Salinivibrio kushneri]OOE43496.1 dihydroorotate dehydrogenase (quinone) [Salinivibrio kushneri]OOE45468.1 dihydroorotate dehydrogenase (quinone) [Salinivibrio kushneri]
MLYRLARPAIFQLDPEKAHDLTINTLSRYHHTPLRFLYSQQLPPRPVTVMGLNFNNPVGLAAGLDKNGECIEAFGAMGFGFVEVGTVTPRPQPGNDKPRLFRIIAAEGIINRMGFNNQGVDALVENVKRAKNFDGVLGINIGKNKDTPIEQGTDDYLACMRKVYPHADYIAVNISSPNTPGLRTLQYGEMFDELLSTLKAEQAHLADTHDKYVPLTVKIAPDLSEDEIQQVAQALIRHQIDGVIATNTTLERSLVDGMPHYREAGGLSGRPVQLKSTEVIRQLHRALDGAMPIIGVGGIDSVTAAREKLEAGADLVQVYSGLIYQGPGLIKQIVRHI